MSKRKWVVDASHSSVDFSIKHMMFAKVKGTFHAFEANIVADPEDLTTAEIEFSVDLSSVDTRSADRDNHLRSADFFDVENHPKMTFKAAEIVKQAPNVYRITGDLTLHGVTNKETFSAEYGGTGKNPWGVEVAGFSVEGKINRQDYGLKWNAALEAGGFLVGDDVQISLELEANKA